VTGRCSSKGSTILFRSILFPACWNPQRCGTYLSSLRRRLYRPMRRKTAPEKGKRRCSHPAVGELISSNLLISSPSKYNSFYSTNVNYSHCSRWTGNLQDKNFLYIISFEQCQINSTPDPSCRPFFISILPEILEIFITKVSNNLFQ